MSGKQPFHCFLTYRISTNGQFAIVTARSVRLCDSQIQPLGTVQIANWPLVEIRYVRKQWKGCFSPILYFQNEASQAKNWIRNIWKSKCAQSAWKTLSKKRWIFGIFWIFRVCRQPCESVLEGFPARRRILAGFLWLSEIGDDKKISRAKSVLEKRPVEWENTLFIQYSDIFTTVVRICRIGGHVAASCGKLPRVAWKLWAAQAT